MADYRMKDGKLYERAENAESALLRIVRGELKPNAFVEIDGVLYAPSSTDIETAFNELVAENKRLHKGPVGAAAEPKRGRAPHEESAEEAKERERFKALQSRIDSGETLGKDDAEFMISACTPGNPNRNYKPRKWSRSVQSWLDQHAKTKKK